MITEVRTIVMPSMATTMAQIIGFSNTAFLPEICGLRYHSTGQRIVVLVIGLATRLSPACSSTTQHSRKPVRIECARSHLQQFMPTLVTAPMTEKDQLFEQFQSGMNNFVFDERVVRVFPDMINRSVPGYSLILPMLGVLARRCVQPESHVYDLGCSLGAVSRVIRESVSVPGVRIIAVDNSADMLKRFAGDLKLLPASEERPHIELILGDVSTVAIQNASLSVLNFTLQFIERDQRAHLLSRIAAGTRPGGALVLSEKIRFDDPVEHSLQTEWHHDFKRAQGYSDLEIARKRDALERVLLPDTEAEHLARLKAAGWSKAVRWFQCFNFVSYLALR
jgi:tRNA (cmo5U34)-methyltransferase